MRFPGLRLTRSVAIAVQTLQVHRMPRRDRGRSCGAARLEVDERGDVARNDVGADAGCNALVPRAGEETRGPPGVVGFVDRVGRDVLERGSEPASTERGAGRHPDVRTEPGDRGKRCQANARGLGGCERASDA
eukprot:2992086-Rhodomonas_salina.3